MKSSAHPVLRVLHFVEDAFLVLLLVLMIGLAVTQIVWRNGFDGGLLWGDALLRVLVLWIALWGGVVASRNQSHLSIDIVTKFVSPIAQRVALTFSSLFAVCVSLMLAYYSYDFVKMEMEYPSMAFANVPTWLCEIIMPIGFSFIAIRYFIYAINTAIFGVPAQAEADEVTPQ